MSGDGTKGEGLGEQAEELLERVVSSVIDEQGWPVVFLGVRARGVADVREVAELIRGELGGRVGKTFFRNYTRHLTTLDRSPDTAPLVLSTRELLARLTPESP